jgi:hypothetical protein
MDIDTILLKWDEAKKQKNIYEKECEDYKGAVERYMNKKNKNIIEGTDFIVSRRSNVRQQLSKQNVPPEIWNKYSTRFSYFSYHLKKQ